MFRLLRRLTGLLQHSDLGGALSTGSRRGAARLVNIVVVVFGTGTVRVIAAEQIHDLLEAELERVLLHASLDGRLREQTLLLLQLEDTLLYRLLDGELVDDDVDCLCEAVNSVNGLLLNKLGGKITC